MLVKILADDKENKFNLTSRDIIKIHENKYYIYQQPISFGTYIKNDKNTTKKLRLVDSEGDLLFNMDYIGDSYPSDNEDEYRIKYKYSNISNVLSEDTDKLNNYKTAYDKNMEKLGDILIKNSEEIKDVVDPVYMSNCLLEAIKEKIKKPKSIKIHKKGSWFEIFTCKWPHFYWIEAKGEMNYKYHFRAEIFNQPFLKQIWFEGRIERFIDKNIKEIIYDTKMDTK